MLTFIPSLFRPIFWTFHLHNMLVLTGDIISNHPEAYHSLPGQKAYASHTQCLYNYRLHVITQHTHVYLLNPEIILLSCAESQHISAICLLVDSDAD